MPTGPRRAQHRPAISPSRSSIGASASGCRATRFSPSGDSLPDANDEVKIVNEENLAVAADPSKSDDVAVQIVGMNKWYGDFHVLRDINLAVYRGERIVICGPSGSGKSTLI